MSTRDRVYICVTREEATEILAGLWVACRYASRDEGSASFTRLIMEHMCDIAEAIDYHDKRYKLTVFPDSIGRSVIEGAASFPDCIVDVLKEE